MDEDKTVLDFQRGPHPSEYSSLEQVNPGENSARNHVKRPTRRLYHGNRRGLGGRLPRKKHAGSVDCTDSTVVRGCDESLLPETSYGITRHNHPRRRGSRFRRGNSSSRHSREKFDINPESSSETLCSVVTSEDSNDDQYSGNESSPPTVLLQNILKELYCFEDPEMLSLKFCSLLDDIILCLNTRAVNRMLFAELLRFIVSMPKSVSLCHTDNLIPSLPKFYASLTYYIKNSLSEFKLLRELTDSQCKEIQDLVDILQEAPEKEQWSQKYNIFSDLKDVLELHKDTVPQDIIKTFERLMSGETSPACLVEANTSSASCNSASNIDHRESICQLKEDSGTVEGECHQECSIFSDEVIFDHTISTGDMLDDEMEDNHNNVNLYIRHQLKVLYTDLNTFSKFVYKNRDTFSTSFALQNVSFSVSRVTDSGVVLLAKVNNTRIQASSGMLVILRSKGKGYFGELYNMNSDFEAEVLIRDDCKGFNEFSFDGVVIIVPTSASGFFGKLLELGMLVSDELFAFQEFFLSAKKCEEPPDYGPVIDESCKNLISEFDENHRAAAEMCLSRKFSLVQTPPQTGAIEFIEAIVKTFLQRETIWYSRQPILILSHSELTSALVYEKLKDCSAVYIKREDIENKFKQPEQDNIRIILLRNKITGEKKNIDDCLKLINKINKIVLTPSELRDTILSIHGTDYFRGNTKPDAVFRWLRCRASFSSMLKEVEQEIDRNISCAEDNLDELTFERHQGTGEKSSSSTFKIRVERAYFEKVLRRMQTISEDEISELGDIYDINFEQRWKLYKFWLDKFVRDKWKSVVAGHGKIQDYAERIRALQGEAFAENVAQYKVVISTVESVFSICGFVRNLRPSVLIALEASQIGEPESIAMLTNSLKQVILLGDHVMLQPSSVASLLLDNQDFYDGHQFQRIPSLFERLIERGTEPFCLSFYSNLSPEITGLLTPCYYEKLFSSRSKHVISGMMDSVFFLNIKLQSSIEESLKACSESILCLCRHLLDSNHPPSTVTILTLENAGLELQTNVISECSNDLRVFDVTDFCPNRNEIIILYFNLTNVRHPLWRNKLLAAIASADSAFFAIGPLQSTFDEDSGWDFATHLASSGVIKSEVRLYCKVHPSTCCRVLPSPFFNSETETCPEACDVRLNCGHQCPKTCHFRNPNHDDIWCVKTCGKIVCTYEHRCPSRCCDPCPPCTAMVTKLVPRCNHEVQVQCNQSISAYGYKCLHPCNRILPCGHNCTRLCYEICVNAKCTVVVEKRLSNCNHIVKMECNLLTSYVCKELVLHQQSRCPHDFVPCHRTKVLSGKLYKTRPGEECTEYRVLSIPMVNRKLAYRCTEPCEKILSCGHKCDKRCYSPCLCSVKTLKTFPCGHSEQRLCSDKMGCKRSCEKMIERCNHTCSEYCANHPKDHRCNKTVFKTFEACAHSGYVRCEQIVCTQSCKKTLPCGHKCTLKCYEDCSTKRCAVRVVQENPCGHSDRRLCWDTSGCKSLCGQFIPKCKHYCVEQCLNHPAEHSCNCKHCVIM